MSLLVDRAEQKSPRARTEWVPLRWPRWTLTILTGVVVTSTIAAVLEAGVRGWAIAAVATLGAAGSIGAWTVERNLPNPKGGGLFSEPRLNFYPDHNTPHPNLPGYVQVWFTAPMGLWLS